MAGSKPESKPKKEKKIRIAIKPKSKRKVREDLINQLKAKGADVLIFVDLIDRYMFYRDLEIEMHKNIAEKGLEYPTVSATGKNYVKENPSVKQAVLYNKQCLAILQQLGLNPKEIEDDTEDDEL